MGGANVCVFTVVSATISMDVKTHTNTTAYAGNLILLNVFSRIVTNLLCIISFRLRCKRMRFYVVFAGTCIL